MDMSQYRDLFVSEARRHLAATGELIVRLEDNLGDREAVDEIFRHAHSLKGMAATMQFDAIATLAHRMEDLLGKVRSNEFPFSSDIADLLLEGSDLLSAMVAHIENASDEQPDAARLIERLTTYTPRTTQSFAERRQNRGEPGSARGDEPDQPGHQFRASDSFKSVRVKTEVLDRLVNITGELITTRHHLANRIQKTTGFNLEEPLNQLSILVRELRDEVFQARMLPFSFVAERFPRLVRDVARRQEKEVAFRVEGKEIELDRGILEEVAEPVVHLLRNAIDHGMETPDEREAASKPRCGVITLGVTRDKDHVDIVVSDDGRGMDPSRIVAKAVEKGIVTPEQARGLSRQAALMLVCTPGFSTAEKVSDISGRGVGMDAVRETAHRLGGGLSIESSIGGGTRTTLRLPITVSIIHALLVDCGPLTVAFPVNAVSRTTELRRDDIFEENGRKVFALGDRRIPVKSLNRLLGQEMPRKIGTIVPVVVAETSGGPIGLITDRFLGQQEIFVKPLGLPLNRMNGVSGGALMGDGRIVFVMDASALA